MTQAKYFPILFSAEMVRAILDGKKTQTRRIIKPQPDQVFMKKGEQQLFFEHAKWKLKYAESACHYGWIGDKLWVRENMTRWNQTIRPGCTYDAARPAVIGTNPPESYCGRAVWQWKLKTLPSIFMPRWASRITLEITRGRVEQLQSIDEEDAWAEGVQTRDEFIKLWKNLHRSSPYTWKLNPWVWVIEFKVKLPNDK